jgi:hypothetical protein
MHHRTPIKKYLAKSVDTENIHYYGWERISKEIQKLANDVHVNIIDYVDNYFYNDDVDIIKTSWYGIIHHTNSTFSSNNITNLFNINKFVISLKECKGIITLSEYNKDNILKELRKVYIDVPIYVLKHPMPPTFNKFFTRKNFENNLKIYNIGGWMRNPYSIYDIKITYDGNLINKYKLKGTLMDQYFPVQDINYRDIIKKYIIDKTTDFTATTLQTMLYFSRPNNNINYFIKYLLEYIYNIARKYNINDYNKIYELLISNHNSTQVQCYVSNEEYLNILTSSVVFADYIDCSASNTIVECIATCTPIIVNRHPAIVEYLGDDYPLYIDKIYNENNETLELTTVNVTKAHNLLYHIRSHGDLCIDNFISKLKNIVYKKHVFKRHR